MALVYYFLKTKHNQELTDSLETAISNAEIDCTVIEDGHNLDCPNAQHVRSFGIRAVPSIVAINDDTIKINETNDPDTIATFVAETELLLGE